MRRMRRKGDRKARSRQRVRRMRALPERRARQRTLEASDDAVAAVYSAADCHIPVDDRPDAGGTGRLQAVAYLGIAAGGLSHDPDCHVLSGSESGRGWIKHYGTAGAAVWTAPGTEPDDLEQHVWQLGDHAAIQFGRKYRRRRAGGA